MARARQPAKPAPKPKAKPRPKAKRAPKRQPKRILNCIPSPEREDDWRLDTAEDAGVVAAAPRIPARKDDRGPAQDQHVLQPRPRGVRNRALAADSCYVGSTEPLWPVEI